MVRFTIYLDDTLAGRIRRAAKRAGRSRSEFIREIARAKLDATDRNESLLQRAKRLGVIGIVDNAPPDLSTNKKYFDNFGKRNLSDSNP